MKMMILNGPNLNMLGIREPEVYGSETYDDLCATIERFASEKSITADIFQSSSEGELIELIHSAYRLQYDALIINPAAYTHYSYAIFDAVKGVGLPCVEVHISNIHKRESFRDNSVIAPACIGQICGLGFSGYLYAMGFLAEYCSEKNK